MLKMSSNFLLKIQKFITKNTKKKAGLMSRLVVNPDISRDLQFWVEITIKLRMVNGIDLIAALSDEIYVIDTGLHSGTETAVKAAMEYGREIFMV